MSFQVRGKKIRPLPITRSHDASCERQLGLVGIQEVASYVLLPEISCSGCEEQGGKKLLYELIRTHTALGFRCRVHNLHVLSDDNKRTLCVTLVCTVQLKLSQKHKQQ